MAKEATGDATAKDSQTGDVQATGGGNPGTPAAGASATTPAETPASSKENVFFSCILILLFLVSTGSSNKIFGVVTHPPIKM